MSKIDEQAAAIVDLSKTSADLTVDSVKAILQGPTKSKAAEPAPEPEKEVASNPEGE